MLGRIEFTQCPSLRTVVLVLGSQRRVGRSRTNIKASATELSRRLLEIARAEKIERVIAEILLENIHMQRVGFRMQLLPDGGVHAVYEIASG